VLVDISARDNLAGGARGMGRVRISLSVRTFELLR